MLKNNPHNCRLQRNRKAIQKGLAPGVGFEPPALFVLGWMNTGCLRGCEVLSSDNSLTISFKVYLTLNRLADAE
jgi:hypothetical protein